eukprot:NODE_2451_length_426_cov_131.973475_g2370_i0.p1 GENE.NODE_2451_length_426_cov_131.973475_g2370_i0~~NODE_2451_length_426_cov_131.973475_g2370_i0.p1  ORF type:complete len:67 (-),score=9.83 NODE_2451_length_426_cov_131.973475_g2370_i0:74-274(-)
MPAVGVRCLGPHCVGFVEVVVPTLNLDMYRVESTHTHIFIVLEYTQTPTKLSSSPSCLLPTCFGHR